MSAASFIAQIGPIVQKYAALYGYRFPSAIIAQASLADTTAAAFTNSSTVIISPGSSQI